MKSGSEEALPKGGKRTHDQCRLGLKILCLFFVLFCFFHSQIASRRISVMKTLPVFKGQFIDNEVEKHHACSLSVQPDQALFGTLLFVIVTKSDAHTLCHA